MDSGHGRGLACRHRSGWHSKCRNSARFLDLPCRLRRAHNNPIKFLRILFRARAERQGEVMRVSSGLALRMLVLLLLLASPAVVSAQQVERPPTFNAAQIPGIKRVGENYTIRNPVNSDGILRTYVLATPYGEIPVQG